MRRSLTDDKSIFDIFVINSLQRYKKTLKKPKKSTKTQKNALFLHFFLYYDIFWRFVVVILHRQTKNNICLSPKTIKHLNI